MIRSPAYIGDALFTSAPSPSKLKFKKMSKLFLVILTAFCLLYSAIDADVAAEASASSSGKGLQLQDARFANGKPFVHSSRFTSSFISNELSDFNQLSVAI